MKIAYKSGYKYQLHEAYLLSVDIVLPIPIETEYIAFAANGYLIIREGYAWDGPSGPTVDTLNFMRGSLVHDALYQLMREGHLDHNQYREQADRCLQRICREDGMSRLRAWWVYWGVRLGGGPSADPAKKRPVIYAP